MTENDVAELMRTAGAAIAVPPAPVDRIVAAGRRRVRRRRVAQVVGTVVAAGVVAGLVPLGIRAGSELRAASGSAERCPAVVAPAVLPSWARTGFRDPEPRSPYVLGDHGEIVAILFGELASPPAPGRANKILWVARDPGGTGPLTIVATRDGSPAEVRELPGGPGPSTIDLPDPGCWSLQLTWGDHTDRISLGYGGST